MAMVRFTSEFLANYLEPELPIALVEVGLKLEEFNIHFQ